MTADNIGRNSVHLISVLESWIEKLHDEGNLNWDDETWSIINELRDEYLGCGGIES